MDNMTGQRIRELRSGKGITQSELAEMLDKTCSAPRMWELGKSMPDAATIKKLASYFGCSSDYLLDISDFKTEKEKIDYLNTEKLFYQNLSRLRDRDKIHLIKSLNNYIESYKNIEGTALLGFEHFALILNSIAKMFDEIKSATERRNQNEGNEEESDKKCKQNVDGIISIGEQKLKTEEELSRICRKLLAIYLQEINGAICCNRDQNDPEQEATECSSEDNAVL